MSLDASYWAVLVKGWMFGAAYTPTEIVPAILKNETEAHGCPGGLIALTVSSRVWKAFVESEIGKVKKLNRAKSRGPVHR